MNLEPLPEGAGAVVVIPSMANTLENLIENPPNQQQAAGTKPKDGTNDDDETPAPGDPDDGDDVDA